MAEVYRLKSLILIKHEIQNGIGANSLLTGLCYPEITAASVLRRNSWHTPRPRTTGSQSEFSRHPSWGLSKEVQSRVSLGELLAYRRHQRSWHRMRPPKAVVFKPRVCIYNVVQAQIGMGLAQSRGEEAATANAANPSQKLERNWRSWREAGR